MPGNVEPPSEATAPSKGEELKKAFGLIANNTHNFAQAARDLRTAADEMGTERLARALGYQLDSGHPARLRHNGHEVDLRRADYSKMTGHSEMYTEMAKIIRGEIDRAVDGLANIPVDAKTAYMDQRSYDHRENKRITELPHSLETAVKVLQAYSDQRVQGSEQRQKFSQAKRDVRLLSSLAEQLGDSAALLIEHNGGLADRQSRFASDAAADRDRDKKVASYKGILATSRKTALEDETQGNPGYQRYRSEAHKHKRGPDDEPPAGLKEMLAKYEKKPSPAELAADPSLAARGDIEKA